MFSGLDVDEAYNLQVSWHLWYERSYATAHGWFDPYISTGPTVLIPAALFIPLHPLAARLVTIAYLVALTYVVQRWYTGSYVRTLLWFGSLWVLPHGQLYLTHVLGEIPGLFFVLAGFVAISKTRYGLGGVLLGLAVVTKQIYVLALVPLLFERKLRALLIALIPASAWQLLIICHTAGNREVVRALAWPRIDMFTDRLMMIGQELGINEWLWLVLSLVIWTWGAQRRNAPHVQLLSQFAWAYGSYYLLLYSNHHYRTLYPLLVVTVLICCIMSTWEKKKLPSAFLFFWYVLGLLTRLLH